MNWWQIFSDLGKYFFVLESKHLLCRMLLLYMAEQPISLWIE